MAHDERPNETGSVHLQGGGGNADLGGDSFGPCMECRNFRLRRDEFQ